MPSICCATRGKTKDREREKERGPLKGTNEAMKEDAAAALHVIYATFNLMYLIR